MSQLRKLLRKAAFTTSDIARNAPTTGGVLNAEQARQFLQLAIDEQVITPDTRIETSDSPKFEIPRISLANRVLRVGTEAARINTADQTKPASGLMELSTVLYKGEIPISDEVFEDNIERGALADRLVTMIAQAVGRDLEELFIKGDTARTPGVSDPNDAETLFLDSLNGLVKQFTSNLPTAQKIDATTITTYDDLFATMLENLPARFRRNYSALRYYVPVTVADGYQKALSQRGTGLGDQALIENIQTNQSYRGIPVRRVPLLSGTSTVNGTAIDYSQYALLVDPKNIVTAFYRQVRLERWREPREGCTYFLPTVRCDIGVASPTEGILARNIVIAV